MACILLCFVSLACLRLFRFGARDIRSAGSERRRLKSHSQSILDEPYQSVQFYRCANGYYFLGSKLSPVLKYAWTDLSLVASVRGILTCLVWFRR